MIAKIVYLEARGECPDGQQMVAEVILNRVAADNFPDTVSAVIHDTKHGIQFSTARYINTAKPTETQYAAVDAALYGEPILPMDVVYFSAKGENDNICVRCGGHVFCYQYDWR